MAGDGVAEVVRRPQVTIMLLPLSIGIVAGLRAMLAPAVTSWAAWLGWIDLTATGLDFLANGWTCAVLTLLALAELINDQLPSTPSRTVPVQFVTRIVTGATSGGAIGVAAGTLGGGLAAGAIGAIVGTLGGHAARRRLAATFGDDRPAALVEDAVALVGGVLVALASS